VSVRLSQAGVVSKRLDESSWFLFFYPSLCCNEILVTPKLWYFSLEVFPKHQKISYSKSIALSTRSSSSSTVEFVYDTYTTIDESRLGPIYYKLVSCNPLTPLLRFVVQLGSTVVAWDSTDSASRGLSEVAELLVFKNRWRKKTDRELCHPCPPRKQPPKRSLVSLQFLVCCSNDLYTAGLLCMNVISV